MAERPIVQHWKCCVRATGPGVRIPLSPLLYFERLTKPGLADLTVSGESAAFLNAPEMLVSNAFSLIDNPDAVCVLRNVPRNSMWLSLSPSGLQVRRREFSVRQMAASSTQAFSND